MSTPIQPGDADSIQAILFDFDGVIVNSEPLHFQAFQAVLGREGIELSQEEYYRDLIGFDDRGVFRSVFAKNGRPLEPGAFQRVMTRKSQAMLDLIRAGRYPALPGVEALVRSAHRHYPLGICSGALREEIEMMLDGIHLRDCFGVIVAAEDVTVGKPDPSGYLLAARLLAHRAKKPLGIGQCLVVEDAPTVIESARAAGFAVLGVATSYPVAKLGGATYVVESLEPRVVQRAIPQLRLMD
jgi:beta-phosphoglucomutase